MALANALSAMVPHSSIYIPLVSPPLNLPNYIKLDHASQWHKAALLSSAIETVTLQTRSKENVFGPRLGDLTATLNTSGSQNVGFISMSLLDCTLGEDQRDEKNMTIKPTDEPCVIDLSWNGTGAEKHIFGKVKVSRGAMESDLKPNRSKLEVLQGIPER